MRQIRSTNTKPEVSVRSLIHGMGFRFRLHDKRLPGKPDIVLARHRKIIEVHGCFWHQHAQCIDGRVPKSHPEYWTPKLKRNVDRDRSNARALKKLGWQVLVVWECETSNRAAVLEKLKRFLGSPN